MMPAYAGLISSVGLGFLMEAVYLLPLTIAALAVVVIALGYQANKRRGYTPLILGALAGIGLVIGKFVIDADVAVYGSIAALVGASLWNSWPKMGVPSVSTDTLLQLGSIKKENENDRET
jgi:hypothetical protein